MVLYKDTHFEEQVIIQDGFAPEEARFRIELWRKFVYFEGNFRTFYF